MLPSIKQGWRDQDQGRDEGLPTNVIAFIADYLKLHFREVTTCWRLLSHVIMKENYGDYEHVVAHTYERVETVQRLWSFQLGELTLVCL